MAHLNNKVGAMTYDRLVSGEHPAVLVASGVIARVSGSPVTMKRGTVLALNSSTGKLSVMQSGQNANCILCDDVEVGTAADVNTSVYVMGCFNPDALIVADGYALTAADRDTLRTHGIYLRGMQD